MTCIETIKYLYDFMDKEIDKTQYFTMRNHLDNCDECRQRYEFEKGVRALVKAYCMNTAAPAYLRNRIIDGLNSIDRDDRKHTVKEVVYKSRATRRLFAPRSYAIAASFLLFISGGIFYYTNYYDNDSIVDNAVKNHVVAVSDNLIFNEETSVVGNSNKYFSNNLNTKFSYSSPSLNARQVRIVGGLPVKICGTSSPCVIFDKGGNKLSLQIIRKSSFPIKNLEKARLGLKEFYIGNRHGFNSVLWEEDGSTYCLTSDINKNEMLNFALTLTSR